MTIKFKEYVKMIHECEELLKKIEGELVKLSEDDLDDFGDFLIDSFFEDEEDEEYGIYELSDVMEIINELGPEFYDDILAELEYYEEDDELEEGVSRRMKTKSFNRKNRKYMSKTKSNLRKEKAKRRKENRKSKAKRKRYYKINKKKISAYQKSRNTAIKKGKHKTKVRKVT